MNSASSRDSRRARPATCIPATRARRCSVSCWRAAAAGVSCCASRTRTARATARTTSPPRWRISPGSASTGTPARIASDGRGPYRQSERGAIYREHFERLEQQGHAYPCYCTPAELEVARRTQLAAGQPPRYPGTCRALDAAARARARARRAPGCAALRVPDAGAIRFDDLVRGPQSVECASLGDFLIRRADGGAVFFFCNAVDDALMGVTQVLRGDDHLSNTPRQLLLLRRSVCRRRATGTCRSCSTRTARRSRSAAAASRCRSCASDGFLPGALAQLPAAARPSRRAGWLARAGRARRRIPTSIISAARRRISTARSSNTGSARPSSGSTRMPPRAGSRRAVRRTGRAIGALRSRAPAARQPAAAGRCARLAGGARRRAAAARGRRARRRSRRRARRSSTPRSPAFAETGGDLAALAERLKRSTGPQGQGALPAAAHRADRPPRRPGARGAAGRDPAALVRDRLASAARSCGAD